MNERDERIRRTFGTPDDLRLTKEIAAKLGLQTHYRNQSVRGSFRPCVAAMLRIPIDDVPEISDEPDRMSRLIDWATERQLRWWASDELAPVFLDRWIAVVDSRDEPGIEHHVLMEHDRLKWDPNHKNPYDAVTPDDISVAWALIPIDTKSLSGKFWPLTKGTNP